MERDTKLGALGLCFLVGAVFWLLPVPEGVTDNGLHLLGIFIATILGIILKVLPIGAVAAIGITATLITKTLDFETAFAGFDNKVVWLIVSAFFLARAFTKTGLGNRIAYHFVALLGKRTLGLGYGIMATEFILAPAIPSSAARAGGVIYPIMDSLSKSFGSDPALGTERRMGSYLALIAAHASTIASAIFLTSMAGNPIIASFESAQGIDITWGRWALAAIVPGVVALLLMPLIIYFIYPPAVKETPHATRFAKTKLEEMGKMSIHEWLMAGTFVLLVILWVFGKEIGISATAAALLGLCLCLITGVIKWKDVLETHGGWETLFWFAVLIAMATNLGSLGVIEWIGGQMSLVVAGLSWPVALLLLLLAYFYLHYIFASMIAHVVAMYPVFLAVMLGTGAPPFLGAMLLAVASSLCGALTQYASGPSAVLYGAGYVPIGKWYKVGFIMSLVNLVIWIGLGGLWWKLLGLW